MDQPRFDLLDESGRVLATAPLTFDVLTEGEVGDVKQILIDTRVIARGKAAQWRCVYPDGETLTAPVIKTPSGKVAAPMYLDRVELEAGDLLKGCYQVLTTPKDEN